MPLSLEDQETKAFLLVWKRKGEHLTMKNNKELFLMSLLATDAADALSRFCGIL